MLTASQCVVEAYYDGDCSILCPDCATAHDAVAKAKADQGYDSHLRPIIAFSLDAEWNDEGHGVWCDGCGAELAEPWNDDPEED